MTKIVTIVFGGGVSTLGMDVVVKSLENSCLISKVTIDKYNGKNHDVLKNADILLVSLFWFENILQYFRLLKEVGIDPRNCKQKIILGGISAVNTRLLSGFYHYAVLGDGEKVIEKLIGCIIDNVNCDEIGIVKDGDFSPKSFAHSAIIPAHGYIEDRGNNTTRIEIARGCRYKCDFCQIAHTKPYREQPIEIVRHILTQSPTKSVALFAPDRSGYTDIAELESICKKIGKHNTAEDLRLDKVSKMKSVSKLKFGVEGFTEESRKRFRKVSSNQKLIEGLKHIFTTLKKPNGKRHTTATMYMIGDLPGETPEKAVQFWDVLSKADEYCTPPFTLFLTLNSFSAKPFTPMEKNGINPYNKWSDFWRNRPRLKNITIASRGGMLGPSNRITHMITCRGDGRLTKLIFWLANDGNKLFKNNTQDAGRQLEMLIKKQGVNPEYIYGELGESDKLPSSIYTI